MVYGEMRREHQRLKEEIAKLEGRLQQLPEGNLLCAQNGSYYKWYVCRNGIRTYLPKSERKLAEQLALRRYLSCRLKDVRDEEHAIDSYLRRHAEKTYVDKLWDSNPEYGNLLSSYFVPKNLELSEWVKTPYQQNDMHSEQKIYKSCSGNSVRSKSEVLIDMALHTHCIPFRYECALQLEGAVLYPDFTIRHPENGKWFYWEHFGMMDEPMYYANVYKKLHLYTMNGIVPGIHLITTYETKKNPLDMEKVERVIREYFL